MKMRKTILYIAGVLGALLVVVSLLRFGTHRSIRSEIPRITEALAPTPALDEQIGEATRKARRSPTADNLGKLGMIHHASANYTEAATCYRLAIKRDGTDWIWHYYLGYLGVEMGNSEETVLGFTRVLDLKPGVHHAWYYLGEGYRNLGQPEEAESALLRISGLMERSSAETGAKHVDQYPLGVYARFRLARIYQQSGRDSLALQNLHSILPIAPTFGPAYRMLGNTYSLMGDSISAERYGVRANDHRIFVPPVDTLLDRITLLSRSELFLLKKIDEAVDAIHPDWALRLIDQGLTYLPDNRDLLNKAMQVWLWLGMSDQIRASASLHLEQNNDNYLSLYNIGLLYLENRFYPEAAASLERAAELKPGDIECMKYLASAYWFNDRQEEAMALLDQVINTHPDDFDVLADVSSFMFFTLNERRKTIQYLPLLDHLYANNPEVQKMSAWMAAANRDYQSAIGLYISAFAQDPEDMETIRNLGQLLMGLKLWEEAVHFYEEALSYNPNDPYILERLGTLRVTCPDERYRDVEHGMVLAERAFLHYKAQPMNTIAAGRALALAYQAMGETQKALMVLALTLEKAEAHDPGPEYRKLLEDLAGELRGS